MQSLLSVYIKGKIYLRRLLSQDTGMLIACGNGQESSRREWTDTTQTSHSFTFRASRLYPTDNHSAKHRGNVNIELVYLPELSLWGSINYRIPLKLNVAFKYFTLTKRNEITNKNQRNLLGHVINWSRAIFSKLGATVSIVNKNYIVRLYNRLPVRFRRNY